MSEGDQRRIESERELRNRKRNLVGKRPLTDDERKLKDKRREKRYDAKVKLAAAQEPFKDPPSKDTKLFGGD